MQCNRRKALDTFFEEVLEHANITAVLGFGCSEATSSVAEIINYWNLLLVSATI